MSLRLLHTKMAALAPIEAAKRLAAYAAVDRHVKREHKVIGVGSGSTVPFVVERIRERGGNEGRVFVPTGECRAKRESSVFRAQREQSSPERSEKKLS
jgi:ribose 5-phosphate isomerase